MKDRHLQVEADQRLLKLIVRRVDQSLAINEGRTRMLIISKFAVYACMSIAGYAMLYLVDSTIWFVLSYVFFGFAILLFAFNFAHDFSHGTVFRSPTWD